MGICSILLQICNSFLIKKEKKKKAMNEVQSFGMSTQNFRTGLPNALSLMEMDDSLKCKVFIFLLLSTLLKNMKAS